MRENYNKHTKTTKNMARTKQTARLITATTAVIRQALLDDAAKIPDEEESDEEESDEEESDEEESDEEESDEEEPVAKTETAKIPDEEESDEEEPVAKTEAVENPVAKTEAPKKPTKHLNLYQLQQKAAAAGRAKRARILAQYGTQ
jgi:hypothetical protein